MSAARRGWVSFFAAAASVVAGLIVWTGLDRTSNPKATITNLAIADDDGVPRSVILCSPPGETHQEKLPLIVAFHGIGDTPESMMKYSHLLELAADGRCYVVFPAARRGMWSTQTQTASALAHNRDIRFFCELIDAVKGKVPVDSARIHVVGMSNGATFAEMVALALPCQIAAAVGHSGGLPEGLTGEPSDRKVPMLLIAGDADPTGAADWAQTTGRHLGKNGHNVEVALISGLKHEWEVRQNDAIWSFLKPKRLPTPCLGQVCDIPLDDASTPPGAVVAPEPPKRNAPRR